MKYFAFGSNMNILRMTGERKIRVLGREMGILPEYEMRFNIRSIRFPGYGAANINPHPTGVVEGILYDIPDEDILILDGFEGYPDHYLKQTVGIQRLKGAPVEATAYIANPHDIQEGLRPHPDYLRHLLIGGAGILSPEYMRMMEGYNLRGENRLRLPGKEKF